MADTFARLIAPMQSAEFFGRYWSREYLRMPQRTNSHAEWLTLRDLDLFFQAGQVPAAFCNVVAAGTRIPLEEWSRETVSDRGRLLMADTEQLFRSYLDGATLILNQAQRSFPPLSRACRLLTHELRFRVWANVYITPPNSAGFGRHRDDHEVLILQIAGSKQWTVYPPGSEPVDLRLETGDLLYLPRSIEHSAQAAETSCIHITLGLSPLYAFNLVEELAAAAKECPAFQRVVVSSSDAGAQEAFDAEFAASLATLVRDLGVGGLIERRSEALGSEQANGLPGRFTDLVRMREISLGTVIRARSGIPVAICEQGSQIEVRVGSRGISIPVFLKSCLEQITVGPALQIAKLEGLVSPNGKLELVKSLIRIGLVEIVEIS